MISIIGGGPIGSYQAYLLAKKGEKVNVYEEHDKIGKPIQCTGILTHEIHKFLKMKNSFVVNKIKNAKVYAPNGKSITVKFDKEDTIVDRTKFDSHLAEMAEKEGAKIFLKSKYKSNDGKELKIGNKRIKTDILIGADGPHSRVAKNNGLWCNRKFVAGNQVVCELDDLKKDTMEIWMGLGMFAWCVPESKNIGRVGVVSYDKANEHLKELMKIRCKGAKVLERQSGLIPIYNPRQKLKKDFVYLVGDAATQVKSTSYGGIVLGMKAANVLARNKKRYVLNCRKEVDKDLYLSKIIRRTMDNFKIKDHNEFVKLVNQKRIKNILETKSRDYPSKMLLELLIKEPRFMKFALKTLF
ncbi:geranylgeranyl reductase family protein [archaeon]|mgnify:CR=1 FL=1|jgi:digeranylgeranylglycerophospholipid reductase|nr:geranylgeranyl reductase family protein [archaeon]MBT3730868.1 geranylgeranyl reductase family protein [archaeon]MBT4669893.1 geranylgeranyl reductase family protein [archaeon]MBT5030045.1 geranylgeranyl reductase family protein [archaeon]MBT5288146.1 geranylgeranyl reductase family protein [archaeon]